MQDLFLRYVKKYPVYESCCGNHKTHKSTIGELAPGCEWKVNIPANVSVDEYLSHKCDKAYRKSEPGLLQLVDAILPNPVICYHTCKLNLYNAIKRQALYVQKPEDDFVEKFNEWSYKIWDVEIRPFLENFRYSYASWYNGLTRAQQLEIQPWHTGKEEVPFSNTFNMFCKLEKQEVTLDALGEWDWPKNRCISAPEPYIKYVTGPVVSALQELYAKNNVKGYCVDKNWDDLGSFYNKCMSKGLLMTVQGDISGLDRSVTKFLLEINRLSYRMVADKVYHCNPDLFTFFLCEDRTKINCKSFEKMTMKFRGIQSLMKMGHINIFGTRKSGEYPTTHGNTELVARLIRFVMEVVLIYDKDDYELLVKGDDFVIFMVPCEQDTIKEAFKQVFETRGINADGKCKYKSGTALKFLKFGTIFDTDFCSTDTFYCKDCKTHRVTRKLQRYYTLTPFTRNLMDASEQMIDNYKNAIYTADKKWSDNLELFQCFSEKFKVENFTLLKTKNGKKKDHIPVEEGFEEKDYSEFERFKENTGIKNRQAAKDLYFSFKNHPKDKPKPCCNKWHRKICGLKYGWTDEEIDLIIKGIKTNFDVSEILLRGFDHNNNKYVADYSFYYGL